MAVRTCNLSNQSNQSYLIKGHFSNYSDIGNDSEKLLLLPNNNSGKTDTLSSIYTFLWSQCLSEF